MEYKNNKRKNIYIQIFSVCILLTGLCLILIRFMYQNKESVLTQNKNYAADSGRQISMRIKGELDGTSLRLGNYAYIMNISTSIDEGTVNKELLKDIESNAVFDAIRYVDRDGVGLTSDGETYDCSKRDFYYRAMNGEKGLEVIYDEGVTNQVVMIFYAPLISQDDDIYGMLLGVYFAESYLQNMLGTTYFQEAADVTLCLADGTVIANSNGIICEGSLIDYMEENGVIDEKTAEKVQDVFHNGGQGAFICDTDSKTDNIFVTYIDDYDFVLAQTFPKSVTQSMIKDQNATGIEMVGMLIGLFVIYVIVLIIRATKDKKVL